MSKIDLERLVLDLDTNPGLSEEFAALGEQGEAWRHHAQTKGYHLTSEEAAGLVSSYGELTDEDLESIAGGWSGDDEGGGTP